jgi:two-component system chemotaxis response regulator CheY
MPRMDGVELCRRTRRADDDGAYTYFIFMSAFGDREHLLRGMEAGADDYQTKPIDLDELQARLVSAARVVTLYHKLAEKNRVLRRDSQTSFRQARVDSLTGVGNRLRMTEDIGAAWERAKRYGQRYSIAICDVDWFKRYNDFYGHVAGDEVLRQIAQSIREELRRGDAVYRYGGEEFLVLLPEQPLAEAAHAMTRVRRAIEGLRIPTDGGRGTVTISIGVSELAPTDEGPAHWIARADRALYAAKAEGRNRLNVGG